MSDSFDSHTDPETLVLRYLETKREDLRDLILVEYSGMVERLARRFGTSIGAGAMRALQGSVNLR